MAWQVVTKFTTATDNANPMPIVGEETLELYTFIESGYTYAASSIDQWVTDNGGTVDYNILDARNFERVVVLPTESLANTYTSHMVGDNCPTTLYNTFADSLENKNVVQTDYAPEEV